MLTTVGNPGWLGLILQGHTKIVPEPPNVTGDLRIFGARLLQPGAHQHEWIATVETTFLAVPNAVVETIHRESIGYVADGSGLLHTVIHNQLGSSTRMTHDELDGDAPEIQEPLHVQSPVVMAFTDRGLSAAHQAVNIPRAAQCPVPSSQVPVSHNAIKSIDMPVSHEVVCQVDFPVPADHIVEKAVQIPVLGYTKVVQHAQAGAQTSKLVTEPMVQPKRQKPNATSATQKQHGTTNRNHGWQTSN